MNKSKPIIAILFTVVLLAAPMIQARLITSLVEAPVCECCKGPCEGCCCSAVNNPVDKNSHKKDMSCRCELTTVPIIPNLPPANNHSTDDYHLAVNNQLCSVQFDIIAAPQDKFVDKSPPTGESPAIYILNGAFLI